MFDILQEGIEKVGSRAKLARGLGVRHQTFYTWKNVPPGRVLEFEALTGISRYRIRPDIYGPKPKLEAAE